MFRESCNWFLTKIQEVLEYNKSSDSFLGKKTYRNTVRNYFYVKIWKHKRGTFTDQGLKLVWSSVRDI